MNACMPCLQFISLTHFVLDRLRAAGGGSLAADGADAREGRGRVRGLPRGDLPERGERAAAALVEAGHGERRPSLYGAAVATLPARHYFGEVASFAGLAMHCGTWNLWIAVAMGIGMALFR